MTTTIGDLARPLNQLGDKLTSNEAALAAAASDPVATLKAAGIRVTGNDQGAIALSLLHLVHHRRAAEAAESTPGQPLLSRADMSLDATTASAAATSGIRVYFNWAGCVCELDEAWTKKAEAGTSLAAAITSACGAVPGAGACAAVFAAAIAAYSAILSGIDKGNGVYLTITYPQMTCLCGIGAPIPTPV